MQQYINGEVNKLILLLTQIQQTPTVLKSIENIAEKCIDALKHGKKIFFAGNGGSAADSQHLAAELVVRLQYSRPGLPAIALTTDSSILTASANDYSFDYVFARQIEALGQPGDILIGISTSGKSPNILRALEAARAKQLITIGFSGLEAPLMSVNCDEVLNIPSRETSKIQECHIMVGHILCALIEDSIFGAEYDPKRCPSMHVA